MKVLRFLVCILVALAVGAVTFLGIGHTGMSGLADPGGAIYSNLVIYPACILMGAFGFWIVFTFTDPGLEK